MSAETSAKSLYERLGGVYAIATVVDDFIDLAWPTLRDRIMVDPRLNANPLVDAAHHHVSPAGFKYLVTEMSCWATGGPQQYSGRSMYDSHAHLKITAEEWVAFMEDMDDTFDKFSVPKPERDEFIAIIESTKPDIVLSANPESA